MCLPFVYVMLSIVAECHLFLQNFKNKICQAVPQALYMMLEEMRQQSRIRFGR